MGIFKIFAKGIQTTNRRFPVVVYLWIINFVFSLMIVTPLYYLLNRDFSSSLMGDQLGKGIDFLWLGDIFYKYRDFYPALGGWILAPALFYLLLYIFLNGGIIGRIADVKGKVNLQSFFADCGKYFFRFFRVFLMSILGYALVLGLLFRVISWLLNFWKKSASTEWPVIISSNLKFLIAILLFSIVRMFFDYIRIRLVVEDSKKTIQALIGNIFFLRKRFLSAWGLYLLVGLIVVGLGVAYIAVYQSFSKIGVLFVIGFIWQQIYVFSKMWTKTLFFSTEYKFYKSQPSKVTSPEKLSRKSRKKFTPPLKKKTKKGGKN